MQAYSIAGRSRRLGIGKEAYSELEIGKSTNEDKKEKKLDCFMKTNDTFFIWSI